MVTLVRSVRDPINDVELGTLMLDVNLGFLQEFSSRASDWGSGEDPLLFIVNSQDQVVFNSTPLSEETLLQVGADTEHLTVEGESLRIHHTQSSVSGWDLYLVINESVLYRNIYRTTTLQGGLVLVSIILVVLVIWGGISHHLPAVPAVPMANQPHGRSAEAALHPSGQPGRVPGPGPGLQ